MARGGGGGTTLKNRAKNSPEKNLSSKKSPNKGQIKKKIGQKHIKERNYRPKKIKKSPERLQKIQKIDDMIKKLNHRRNVEREKKIVELRKLSYKEEENSLQVEKIKIEVRSTEMKNNEERENSITIGKKIKEFEFKKIPAEKIEVEKDKKINVEVPSMQENYIGIDVKKITSFEDKKIKTQCMEKIKSEGCLKRKLEKGKFKSYKKEKENRSVDMRLRPQQFMLKADQNDSSLRLKSTTVEPSVVGQ